MKATNTWQWDYVFIFWKPCGRNPCAVKCTGGDRRVHEDTRGEWMRAQNEAGGGGRHGATLADRLQTRQTAPSTLPPAQTMETLLLHPSPRWAFAASLPIPQTFKLACFLPPIANNSPCPLLSLPPASISILHSNSTFPDVRWLPHYWDSQAFCCCHLVAVCAWDTVTSRSSLIQCRKIHLRRRRQWSGVIRPNYFFPRHNVSLRGCFHILATHVVFSVLGCYFYQNMAIFYFWKRSLQYGHITLWENTFHGVVLSWLCFSHVSRSLLHMRWRYRLSSWGLSAGFVSPWGGVRKEWGGRRGEEEEVQIFLSWEMLRNCMHELMSRLGTKLECNGESFRTQHQFEWEESKKKWR